ncbi:hypothetical protein [Streptomyces sp. NPDC004528]|uniref:hypothetical protein n=1 Tax=Streptomyces sp. NPDC004528 TaxID=3154550 RepID=UPI0033B4AA90
MTNDRAPVPLTAESVSEILRDPDSPLFPTRITVFCDRYGCETKDTGEYMVSTDMAGDQRLAVARQHLADNAGWQHTEEGDDFCPVHAGSPAQAQLTVELSSAAGTLTVGATEPVPGLRVFEIPADHAPLPDHRWVLAHHEGRALGLFATAGDANGAASAVASMADWTRNAMTTANAISLGGNVERFALALMAHGCAPAAYQPAAVSRPDGEV